MRAHYLQHVPFEGLGSIEGWLEKNGYETTGTRLYESDPFPDAKEIDLLVVMGGPMSVNDEQEFPWLAKEKRFIKETIDSGIPTLGICLGAQLIASAMGGEVYPNPAKEIGWFPVQVEEPESGAYFRFPEETEVFHWHGETFNLPDKATRIAKSRGCNNQAFQIGSNVIGLQFHLETTPASAQAIVDHCRDELIPGEYIQTEQEMLSTPEERYVAINRLMGDVLEYLHNNR